MLGYLSHSFGLISVSSFDLKSSVDPFTTNSLSKNSQGSCSSTLVAPGIPKTTAYFFSSLYISLSSRRIFKNFLIWMAPAVRMAGLMDRSGLPSILSLTRLSRRDNLGLMSLKLLFEIYNVFRLYSWQTESGRVSSLLFERSNTVTEGALSRFLMSVIWL